MLGITSVLESRDTNDDVEDGKFGKKSNIG